MTRPTSPYADPNLYSGSDSDRINAAIRDATHFGGVVRIPRRIPDQLSPRDFWLLDSAILVPENTTLIFSNCRIKLSDQARDNWIRSANCIVGKPDVDWISNVHILGEGHVLFEGADRPRSTGDYSKLLRTREFGRGFFQNDKYVRTTYGTDEGKDGETQHGDWRNIGILLAKVRNFSIQNLHFKQPHCWTISLEYCRQGYIQGLDFNSNEHPVIDGVPVNWLNQDGLDLRNGCRDITIENITGHSGDDLIALTAIGAPPRPAGGEKTHFCGGDPDLNEQHINNILIRNVRGYSAGGYLIVRFLNQNGVRMTNILLDGLLDTSPAGHHGYSAIKIGDIHYGTPAKLGETSRFQITNVQTQAKNAIQFGSPITDSQFSNILFFQSSPDQELLHFHFPGGLDELRNVTF
ncbi:MAG: hypothetical protein IJJ26_00795, partial [Victivallales bacterium]|nr:hypothetical protein [Victivallales bacterium]